MRREGKWFLDKVEAGVVCPMGLELSVVIALVCDLEFSRDSSLR